MKTGETGLKGYPPPAAAFDCGLSENGSIRGRGSRVAGRGKELAADCLQKAVRCVIACK